MDDDLGVGLRVEAVTQRLELRAQLGVVEDLAVENDPHRAILVADRLAAGGEVDDAEPRVREPDSRGRVEAVAVRAAVMQRRDHGFQQVPAGMAAGSPAARPAMPHMGLECSALIEFRKSSGFARDRGRYGARL
ncbi:MAG: hypothetical protein U1F11_06280 [Steroidobacteraceae bacterium]